ncbi:MAG: hypothetical protein K9M57_07315 [Phycisphaerae bacterium]|nr:hypothetical protein [Phycisphaerae bacterium]
MKKSLVALLVLVLLSGFVTAGEMDKGQVASSAKWVAQFDNELWRSSVGYSLLGEMMENKGLTEKFEGHMAKAVEMLGFHPINDIKDVTLYNDSCAKGEGVMLLDGKFNQGKLLALLDNDPAHQEHKYGDAIIHQWYDNHKGKDSFGSIVSEEMVVIGSGIGQVQMALDVLGGQSASLAAGGLLGDAAIAPAGTISSAAITGVGTIAGDHPKAAMLKLVDSIHLTIGEKGSLTDKKTFVNATLTVNSAQTARQVRDIINGMLAFARLSEQKRPVMADLAEAVIVVVDDNRVFISFEYPVEDLFAVMKYMHEMRHQ